MRYLSVIAFLAVFPGAFVALAQHGLATRPAFSAYHGGALPTSAPTFSGSWSAVPAFPNVTFINALGIAQMPGTNTMVVWEREGRVYLFDKTTNVATKTLALDITAKCQGWDDSGLLALAFHPNFGSGPTNNRYVFLYYTYVTPGTVTGSTTTRPNTFKACRDRLARFTVNLDGTLDPASETIFIDQIGASVWHNGGGMFFHPDNGFLYLTNGDDAQSTLNTQRLDRGLFSGVLRIDVDQRGGSISKPITRQPLPSGSVTQNYYIPLDNPFVGQANTLEEFFAIGLRSPHRMTIDPVSKRIFIGDVGLGNWEEVSIIEPTESALNFQWDKIEGLNGDLVAPYIGTNKRPAIHYSHSEGSAVIGGYVYRGTEFANDLAGKYIFGDNGTGTVWYLDESVTPPQKVALCTLPNGSGPSSGSNYVGLSSFGVDSDNELYLCQMSSQGGRIYKLSRAGSPPVNLPATLSATGLLHPSSFGNNNPLAVASGFSEYKTVNPLWSDRAYKYRWFGIPTGQTIGFSADSEWTFPEGSVFLKHFDLPVDDNNPAIARRLETRVLVRNDSGYVYGMTYKWRADNSDADLITGGVTEDVPIIGNVQLGTLTSTDIGAPALSGTTQSLNGGFAITAGGTDIFGTNDQFRFVHTQKTGDFDIATRMEELDRADLYTKAGLMVRESLAANSRNVMALMFPTNEARNNNTGGYEFQSRDTTGGASTAIYPAAPQPQVRFPNAWLRLKRTGDVFTAYHSKNGTQWTPYATKTLSLPATVYFGMAVTSHSAVATTTARFFFNIDRTQPWYYPGRQDCLACHTQPSGGVLGMNTPQANSNYAYLATGITDNQLRALSHVGYFDVTLNEASIPGYHKAAALSDTSATAELRMRSYIDSNCAHCHRPGGVHAFWDGRFETALGSASIINGIVQDALGVNGAKVLAPQSVDRSIMYKRMATATEHYKMPPLAKAVVDQDAIALLEQWITEATQPPADPLPSPWVHADVGTVGFTGDATYSGTTETFIMSGSGDDIWNNADAFHFAYQPLNGDGEIIARVQSLTPTDPFSKAGVMIRESLSAGAKNVMVTLTASNGAQIQHRAATDGISVYTDGPNVSAPYYLKLRRQGHVLTGYVAASNGAWQQIGSVTLAMNQNVLIGMALSAHNNAQTATALFDNVSVTADSLPLALQINFQPAGAPVPEGYLADTGAVFGDRGNGFSYGWDVSNTANARDRNNAASPDQRYDTFNHMQRIPTELRAWQIALPNGTYAMHVVAGDPTTFDSTHKLTAEGIEILSGTTSSTSPFIEATATVVVGDGLLNLAQGSGGSNTKLCYVDITAVQGAVQIALATPGHQSTHYGAAASSIALSATASTTNGSASITSVEFYDGFTLLGSDSTAPYEYIWTTASAGTHQIMAKGIDSTGATGFSTFASITVSADGAFGLEAEYWPNLTQTGTPQSRTDANVQFDWANGVPMDGIPNDNFSVRWRGRIKPAFSETYTFTTESDDGVRLWVNGQLLIDKWVNQGTTQHTGTITLVAGQLYEIEMHYFDNFGAAIARLSWSSTSQPAQLVPGTALFVPDPGTNHRPRTPDIAIPAANGELTDPVGIVMQSSAFEDQDGAQAHAASDWEIWTTTGTPELVWSALNQTGAARTYATLANGTFAPTFTALANSTTYQLRTRHQDSSAATNSEWSAWALRTFVTTPPDDPRGITAEYYSGTTRLSLTPHTTRTENTINYTYGDAEPVTGVGTDNFSVRWRARVKPQFSETYTFTTESDDGARLWVNGQLLVDKWIGQGATQHSGTITLEAGQYYDLEMQYYDGAFGASAKLLWSSASQPQQIIPALRLYAISPTANHRPLAPLISHPATDGTAQDASAIILQSGAFEDQDAHTHAATDWEIWTDEASSTRIWSALSQTGAKRTSIALGDGDFEGSHTGRTSLIGAQSYKLRLRHKDSSTDANSEWGAFSEWRYFTASSTDNPNGLIAEFYNNTQSFQGTPLTRVDANIDFNFGNGSPMAGIGADTYTARWRGRVRPEFSETYTFKTRSDDGARLYVNGVLLVDKFQYQGTTDHTGSIALTAGQYYDLELHYLEGSFGANVQLLWSSASRAEQIIPGGRLFQPLAGANRRPRAPDITAPTGTVSAATPTLQSGAFTDLDSAQTHAATDWEIWTTTGSIERVWSATGRTGAQRLAITLGEGLFENQLLGASALHWATTYQLRLRHRDSSGSITDEWSPFTPQTFTTNTAPWNSWRTTEFTLAEQGNPLLSGETADFDRDGLCNLIEYAFRLSPKSATLSPLAISQVSAGELQVTFPVNLEAQDVIVSVETSTQLTGGTWTSAGVTYEVVSTTGSVQTIRAHVPRGLGEQRRFVRVSVVRP